MNSQGEKQIAPATNLEKAWCEAFQIRKAFIDHFDPSVPEELLRFSHARLDAILALSRDHLDRSALLTEEDIIERAAVARPSPRYIYNVLLFFLLTIGLVTFIPRWHSFVFVHREFIFGVMAGAVVQTGVVFASRWAWDRWLWLKWFSHQ